MSTATATNYLAVIDRLQPGEPTVFQQVDWDEYQQLLDDLGDQPAIHLSYDKGTLEIMTTSAAHDYYGQALGYLIRLVTLRLGIQMRAFGQATIKKSKALAGKEPDGCFYVKGLDRIGTKIQLDFEQDPAPDIAIEVDLSTNTIPKLPIYQRLQVAEVWIYDGYALTIYQLTPQGYLPMEESNQLPGFTGELLTEFLHASRHPADDNELLASYAERIVRTQQP